jgi:hypothetical protein
MSITKECMIVNLSIGRWYGFARDSDLGRSVALTHHADEDATNVNKRLMPSKVLRDVNSTLTAIRNHFHKNTLPWHDAGGRLLTRKLFATFIEEHEALVKKAEVAIEKFITADYPTERDRAEFRMGDVFKSEDYPSQAELRTMYRVRLDFEPVGDASDFRVEMDQKHADSVRQSIERNVNNRIQTAMREVWDRLAKTLRHFHDRMADEDARFKRATIDNLREIIDVLPALNVLDDPDLESIRIDIMNHLSDLDPVELRDNEEMRREVSGEAKRIMDTMDGFMAAFG